jgi:septum site-determining protein MinD
MSVDDLQNVDVGKLPEVIANLSGKADFVLVDSAAGLGREATAAIQAVDEVIIVTNPDLPSVVDALKTAQVAQRLNKNILGVVLNRVRGRSHEMSKEDVEGMIGHKVIAEIPEDAAISRSIAEKSPLLSYEGSSPAAYEIRKLGYKLSGVPIQPKRDKTFNILERLVNWIVG